jgi:hypothetical protein
VLALTLVAVPSCLLSGALRGQEELLELDEKWDQYLLLTGAGIWLRRQTGDLSC